jgi:predicted SnoaL-like aldol condensation-catalyzing enzyme
MRKIISAIIFSSIMFSASAGAALPVTPAKNQQKLLDSIDPKLAANKRLAYDFFRVVLRGRRLDQVSKYMHKNYIQHNPNVETGMKGFVEFFSKLGDPKEIPHDLKGLVAVQAEGDFVTLSFVNELNDPKKKGMEYSTTWFDMFRIQDGKIAEHWDCDTKPAV